MNEYCINLPLMYNVALQFFLLQVESWHLGGFCSRNIVDADFHVKQKELKYLAVL